jgi:hypothetical protein
MGVSGQHHTPAILYPQGRGKLVCDRYEIVADISYRNLKWVPYHQSMASLQAVDTGKGLYI